MPMAVDKTKVSSVAGLAASLTFGALTVSALTAYRHGNVTVFEFTLSDASTRFIKVSSNQGVEIAGTAEMGTGTKVTFV